MGFPKDQRSSYGRRITDRRPKLFDDVEEDETARIWTIVIVYALSALVGTGVLTFTIWAFFKLGGGS